MTIARAIKAGRLSASRGEGGSYQIDPAEPSRVFPLAGILPATMQQLVSPNGAGADPVMSSGEVEGLRYAYCWPSASRRFAILRQRLDAEAEERRRLTAILTDRRSWWRRWFRASPE